MLILNFSWVLHSELMLPIDSFFIDSDRFAFFSAFVDSYEACSSSWKARQADNFGDKGLQDLLGKLDGGGSGGSPRWTIWLWDWHIWSQVDFRLGSAVVLRRVLVWDAYLNIDWYSSVWPQVLGRRSSTPFHGDLHQTLTWSCMRRKRCHFVPLCVKWPVIVASGTSLCTSMKRQNLHGQFFGIKFLCWTVGPFFIWRRNCTQFDTRHKRKRSWG